MIERMALHIAKSIKGANPAQTASVEVMQYSLIAIIGTGSAIFLSILFAAILGTAVQTIIVLVSFMTLRAFSGGYHFDSAEKCTLVSIFGAVVIPLIPLNDTANDILLGAAFVLILLLAPKGKNQSRIFSRKHFPLLKLISLVIVTTNYWIGLPEVTLSFLVQALSLLPFIWKGGETNEETRE
ncbi:accessory gene regulator ArgB-like protein [uncultured Brevibacillus sp.]|uniref:accessory gene regulator ArgB-like protein n=1 Tax=uncultured Brevibacillus sp. TaxID=169970 RepID=UPI0025948894|nr:accessory gene regulator B family protein [uncultured Brevibacillus sp.]